MTTSEVKRAKVKVEARTNTIFGRSISSDVSPSETIYLVSSHQVSPAYFNCHTQTARGTFARLSLCCWHNLSGELTLQHEASITRHLLSGTVLVLDSFSLTVSKSGLKTHLFHLAHNDRLRLT